MRINRIRLVTELTKQDLTQTKLSELSGVSRATINFIKNGKSCSESTAGKIAKALNVPVEQLIDLDKS
ncbi:MAG: helix-turn-helix transcriptional regulator [Lachnospiraceae bacterium]|nr:helix-turn-helix transcriptional regulator [Lachnospiraceae bacterium]